MNEEKQEKTTAKKVGTSMGGAATVVLSAMTLFGCGDAAGGTTNGCGDENFRNVAQGNIDAFNANPSYNNYSGKRACIYNLGVSGLLCEQHTKEYLDKIDAEYAKYNFSTNTVDIER